MRTENEIIRNIIEYAESDEDDSVFEKTFGDRILLFRGDNNYPGMF